TVTDEFQWTVGPFLLLSPGDQLSPEGVPIDLPISVINPTGRPLTYSATNLPFPLEIDAQSGVISGEITNYFLFFGRNFTIPVTVSVSDGTSTQDVNFNWATEPGFHITGLNDRVNADGDSVDSELFTFSPYGHTITASFSGLPSGLTYDAAHSRISGV